MADSRRSPPADGVPGNDVRGAVLDILARALPDGGSVAIALSGGRDSVALLDATTHVADGTHLRAVAFHVHHGLSPNADRWSRFCSDLCAAADIPFDAREVQVAHRAQTGVEAAARSSRYEALAALAHAHRVDALLLAHHADDQAETVLLQLLRGAGPRGLAAMPAIAVDRGVRWLRPFLDVPRRVLDDYVALHRLDFIEDETNRDPRYRRNALRAGVVPALRAIAPGYPRTLVRAARHHAEAAALLDELAELDARSSCDGASLECAALSALDTPRARNLLRWFLHRNGLRAPSSARLGEMLAQLTQAGADACVGIAHDGAVVGVHRGRAVVHRPAPEPYRHGWAGAPCVALPHGTLHFNATRGDGIALRRLASLPITICNGSPGERLRIGAHGRHRPVAELLREAGVPHWDRASLPRLYCGDRLAALPYAGVDAAFQACGDEPAVALDWRPR